MLTIILPLPAKALSPNARVHWRVKAKSTAKARGDAQLAAINAMNEEGICAPYWKKATAKGRFYFRTNRAHDQTNLQGSLKASEDGFTDACVWKDDSGVVWLPPEVFVDAKKPRVEVEIQEIP